MDTIRWWMQDLIYKTDILWAPDFVYAGEMYKSGHPRWMWVIYLLNWVSPDEV